MKIIVKTLQGKNVELEVEKEEKLIDLREKIVNQMSVKIESQKLIYYGRIMAENDKKIVDYGIKDNDFVVLLKTKKVPVPEPVQESKNISSTILFPASKAAAPLTKIGTFVSPNSSSATTGIVMQTEHERTISNLIEMGFKREEAERAMRAAFNNPRRAIDYLLNETSPGAANNSSSGGLLGSRFPPLIRKSQRGLSDTENSRQQLGSFLQGEADSETRMAQSASSSFGGASISSSLGGASKSSSVFSASTPSSLFGEPTSSSVFGASAHSSVFGASAHSSVFGASTPSSVFGASTSSSVFGAPPPGVSNSKTGGVRPSFPSFIDPLPRPEVSNIGIGMGQPAPSSGVVNSQIGMTRPTFSSILLSDLLPQVTNSGTGTAQSISSSLFSTPLQRVANTGTETRQSAIPSIFHTTPQPKVTNPETGITAPRTQSVANIPPLREEEREAILHALFRQQQAVSDGRLPHSRGSEGERIEVINNFNEIQQRILENPTYLREILAEIKNTTPELYSLIHLNLQMILQVLIRATSETAHSPPPASISTIPEDKAAIDRLKALGYTETQAVQAYRACNNNEMQAANLLSRNREAFLIEEEKHPYDSMKVSQRIANPIPPAIPATLTSEKKDNEFSEKKEEQIQEKKEGKQIDSRPEEKN